MRAAMWYLLLPLGVLLPIWTVVGRVLMGGQAGWMTLISLVVFAPILLVGLAVSIGLIFGRPDGWRSRRVSWLDSALLSLLIVCVFGWSFFMPDSDDVQDLPSVATHAFSSLSSDTSSSIALPCLAIGGLAVVALCVETLLTCIFTRRRRSAPDPYSYPARPQYPPQQRFH